MVGVLNESHDGRVESLIDLTANIVAITSIHVVANQNRDHRRRFSRTSYGGPTSGQHPIDGETQQAPQRPDKRQRKEEKQGNARLALCRGNHRPDKRDDRQRGQRH